MSEHRTLEDLSGDGVIAVVRLPDARPLRAVAEALLAGGVRGIEVTLTTANAHNALQTLAEEARRGAGWIVGAGSVLTAADAHIALSNGAQFLVSPALCESMLDETVRRAALTQGVPVIPGAFSPTEIWRAHHSGAEVIKLFPAARLEPAFLKDILAPFPGLKIMPTGGISLDNTADWIRAGAVAVGVGSALVDPKLVAAGKFRELTERARRFVERVAEARQ